MDSFVFCLLHSIHPYHPYLSHIRALRVPCLVFSTEVYPKYLLLLPVFRARPLSLCVTPSSWPTRIIYFLLTYLPTAYLVWLVSCFVVRVEAAFTNVVLLHMESNESESESDTKGWLSGRMRRLLGLWTRNWNFRNGHDDDTDELFRWWCIMMGGSEYAVLSVRVRMMEYRWNAMDGDSVVRSVSFTFVMCGACVAYLGLHSTRRKVWCGALHDKCSSFSPCTQSTRDCDRTKRVPSTSLTTYRRDRE